MSEIKNTKEDPLLNDLVSSKSTFEVCMKDINKELKVEDCLIKLNDKSKNFQLLVISIFSFMYFFLGFQSGTYIFMFLTPLFSITVENNGETILKRVPESVACLQKSYKIESVFTSLSLEKKLYCDLSYKKDTYEFFILLFGTLTSALFILMIDQIGRKKNHFA